MNSLQLTCKLTSKPFDMTDIIDMLCKEANCLKTLKEMAQPQSKAKKAPTQLDEALTASTTSKNSSSRHCPGKCHHCGKEGHWICECCTKKREEAQAANASSQAAQTSSTSTGTTTTPKPETKPVGSANTVDNPINDFFAAEKEEDPVPIEPDLEPLLSDNNSYNKQEAFCTETWGVEDNNSNNFDLAKPDDWLVNEGEGQDIVEEADTAAILPEEEDTSCSEPQPILHTAPHVHAVSSTPVPLEIPNKDSPKLVTCAHEGQAPSTNNNMCIC